MTTEETTTEIPRPEYWTVEVVYADSRVIRHQHIVNYRMDQPTATYFFFQHQPEAEYHTVITQWLHDPTIARVIIAPEA